MREQRLWTWHLGAGAVILVLLGLHMTIMHLGGVVRVFSPQPGEPIDWANVAARGRSAFFLVSYVILLAAALFHGLYGLRNILFELNPAVHVKRILSAVLLIAGFALFAVGTWAAWVGFTVARGAQQPVVQVAAQHRGRRCARPARRDDREYQAIFDGGATPPGGMQRRPNAAGSCTTDC